MPIERFGESKPKKNKHLDKGHVDPKPPIIVRLTPTRIKLRENNSTKKVVRGSK